MPKNNFSLKITGTNLQSNQNASEKENKNTCTAVKRKKQNALATAIQNSSLSENNIGQDFTMIPGSSTQAASIAIPVSTAYESLSRSLAIDDIPLQAAWIKDPSSLPGSSVQATITPLAIPVSSANEVRSRPLAIDVPHHVAWTKASAFPIDYFPSTARSVENSSLNTDKNKQR